MFLDKHFKKKYIIIVLYIYIQRVPKGAIDMQFSPDVGNICKCKEIKP